jgi:O-acetyl-ADP-ribose deacetylase (regulator of RNase III)
MNIEFKQKKMNVLDAPEGAYILHSVNCKGVMGSGFAKVIREKCKESYQHYVKVCDDLKSHSACLLGKALICNNDEKDNYIVHLFTSDGYGDRKDNEDSILANTRASLEYFFNTIKQSKITIYSVKFNSGLFEVPWEKTVEIIKQSCMFHMYKAGQEDYESFKNGNYSIEWVVCEL